MYISNFNDNSMKYNIDNYNYDVYNNIDKTITTKTTVHLDLIINHYSVINNIIIIIMSLILMVDLGITKKKYIYI